MEETIRILLAYGPGGVIAALVIFGVLVPKAVNDREIRRGDTATESNAKNAEALKTVTDALKIVVTSNVSLKEEVAELKTEVATIAREFRDFRIGRGA